MDDEVCRASRCRPKGITPDPKMAEGGSIRGRELVEDRGRDSSGSGDDSPNAKDNFEFERRLNFLRKSGTR